MYLPNVYSSPNTIRSAAILTTSYVAGTVLSDCTGYNQLVLYVAFTIGSLTDAQIKIEYSPDGVTYYQETYDGISGGTNTESLGARRFTATGNYRITVPVRDRYIRVSAIGTGTVTGSSMAISGILAWA